MNCDNFFNHAASFSPPYPNTIPSPFQCSFFYENSSSFSLFSIQLLICILFPLYLLLPSLPHPIHRRYRISQSPSPKAKDPAMPGLPYVFFRDLIHFLHFIYTKLFSSESSSLYLYPSLSKLFMSSGSSTLFSAMNLTISPLAIFAYTPF